ncbi:MAG TPA: helix-hairpin-helix domain-containing protein, partial [Phenylobacterium sp.]|nr:helix-hairpin-helix domain-containing protein [Phenylobacterium sp.]
APGEDLDLAIDPKLAWALKNREQFPVDLNSADRERLLRVPGLGAKGVDRLIAARRQTRLRLADVKRICRSVEKLKPFVVAEDWRPGGVTDAEGLRARFAPPPEQPSLF